MYGFIIFIGIVSILYGAFEEYGKEEDQIEDFGHIELLYILEKRVDNLEDNLNILLYNREMNDSIDEDSLKEEDIENLEELIGELNQELFKDKSLSKKTSNNKETIRTDKYSLFEEYRHKDYPLEKICKELDMTKGEVLLLENLYKRSKK